VPEQLHKCTGCGGAFPAGDPYWKLLEQPRFAVDDYVRGPRVNVVKQMYVCGACTATARKRAPDLWEGKR
jgi:hypothetical protein